MKLFQIMILIIIVASCTGKEGCNDPIAKNFDAEADKNCCCEYYQLRFDMAHSIDSFETAFNLMDYYTDANAAAYQIKSASILISEVALIKNDGSAHYTSDSVLTELRDGSSVWLRDDFTYIKPGTFISNPGSFVHFGNYSKLRFLVGLTGKAAETEGDAAAGTHPLSSSNGFYDSANSRYYSGKWEIIKNTSDTTIYLLSDTVWVELDYPAVCADGSDTRIPLGFNYLTLTDGIVFASDDSVTVVQKIKNNIRNAFYIQ